MPCRVDFRLPFRGTVGHLAVLGEPLALVMEAFSASLSHLKLSAEAGGLQEAAAGSCFLQAQVIWG